MLKASSIRSLFYAIAAYTMHGHNTALCTGVAYASCGKNYEPPLSSASKLWLTKIGGVGKCQHDNATELMYSVAAVISDLYVYMQHAISYLDK